MKSTFQMLSWNWYMTRRGVYASCLLLAGLQLLYLCARALNPAAVTHGYTATFTDWLCPAVFALCYFLALAASLRLLCPQGRSQPQYTLVTLGLPRWTVLLAQVLTSALALLLVAAVQVLLAAVYYLPFTALQAYTGRLLVQYPVVTQGQFWWSMATNWLVRVLAPTNAVGVACLLVYLLVPGLVAAGVLLHRSWRRIAAAMVTLAAAGCCALLLKLQNIALVGQADPALVLATAVVLGVLVVLSVLSWCGGVYALRYEVTR